jgi:hypothetical protein
MMISIEHDDVACPLQAVCRVAPNVYPVWAVWPAEATIDDGVIRTDPATRLVGSGPTLEAAVLDLANQIQAGNGFGERT